MRGDRQVVCGSPAIHYFPSAAEHRRWAALRLAQRYGEIRDLELQPVYPVVINGLKVCEYRADFRYLDRAGVLVVEDVKGEPSPEFMLKKRLVEVLYPGTVIRLVRGS